MRTSFIATSFSLISPQSMFQAYFTREKKKQKTKNLSLTQSSVLNNLSAFPCHDRLLKGDLSLSGSAQKIQCLAFLWIPSCWNSFYTTFSFLFLFFLRTLAPQHSVYEKPVQQKPFWIGRTPWPYHPEHTQSCLNRRESIDLFIWPIKMDVIIWSVWALVICFLAELFPESQSSFSSIDGHPLAWIQR